MRYLLIDANHLAARCAATQVTELRASDGKATGVIHGTLRGLSYVRNLLKVDFSQIITCWDGGRSEYRMKLYPEYKAGRRKENPTEEDKKSRQEYYDQIEDIKQVLECVACRQIHVKGVEADDLIACCARSLATLNHEVVIFSGDHDFHQLSDQWIRILSPKEDEPKNLSQVLAIYGLDNIKQLLLYKAIVGDSSDNISGIYGIGPVKCLLAMPYLQVEEDDIISQYQPCEGPKSQKCVDKILAGKEIVQRNLKLVRLPTNISQYYTEEQSIEVTKQFNTTPPKDTMKFLNMLRKLELQSILDNVHYWT